MADDSGVTVRPRAVPIVLIACVISIPLLFIAAGWYAAGAYAVTLTAATAAFVLSPALDPQRSRERRHWVGISVVGALTIVLVAFAFAVGRIEAAVYAVSMGALIVIIARLRTRYFVLQYAVFLRFPLLFAVFLVAFPIIGSQPDMTMLNNLFVLDARGTGIVVAVAGLLIYTIHTTAGLILDHGQERFSVARSHAALVSALRAMGVPTSLFGPELGSGDDGGGGAVAGDVTKAGEGEGGIALQRRLLLWLVAIHLALSAPLISSLVRLSAEHDGEGTLSRVGMALLGALAGLLLPLAVERLLAAGLKLRIAGKLESWVRWLQQRSGEHHSDEYGAGYNFAVTARAVVLALLTALLYVFAYNALQPTGRASLQLPPLAYLLISAIPMLWFASAVGFYLDRYRVPATAVLVPVWVLLGLLFDTDHYFEVSLRRFERPTFMEAVQVRLGRADEERQPRPRTAVVVTASGGGISASIWTAKVLETLRMDPRLRGLSERIVLVSSVSGGSVGAAYFVEAYTSPASGSARAEAVVRAAAASSLSALGWGIAFPDLLRNVTGFLPSDSRIDRATAIEGEWRARLACLGRPGCQYDPLDDRWISSWTHDVRAGVRPVQVFNATVVETGERYLISPVSLAVDSAHPDHARARARYDMRVMTAARLSATFPYISPVARPMRAREGLRSSFRAADGGYYDNFGVMTAVQAVDELLNDPKRAGILDHVILLQIRLSPVGPAPEPLDPLSAELFGPQYTMLSVRGYTQSERNELEVQLLRAKWKCEVPITSFVFAARLPEEELALSWHLSPAQRDRLMDRIGAIQVEVERLRRTWEAPTPRPDCAMVRSDAGGRASGDEGGLAGGE